MLGQKRAKSSYSFIRPQPKPFFSLLSQIWISLILFVCVLCVSIDFILKFYTNDLENKNLQAQEKYNSSARSIAKIKETITRLENDYQTALNIYTLNDSLKRSVRNIFDIVPDTITLEYILVNINSLELRGKTPSRETFNLLMEAPLKSIFSSVHTSFYQLKGGWLNFSSISTLNEQDKSNE